MVASPFGEKFRLRTRLNIQECYRRLDELSSGGWADALGIANFTGQPMTARKWGFVFFWFPDEQYGAQLLARLRQRTDHVEIRGTVGSNAALFLTVATTAVFVMVSLVVGWKNGELGSLVALPLIPIVAAGYYFLKRRSPFGGPLIDSLQALLEADSILQRQSDPIRRY